MILLHALALFGGLLMLVRSILFWLHFIQLKNYRFDRLKLELKQTSFYALIFSKHRIIVMLLLAGGLSVPYINSQWIFPNGWFIAAATYFIAYTGQTIRALWKHSLQAPAFTIKIRALFVVIFLLNSIAYFYFFGNLAVILFVEFLQPLIVFGVFAIVFLPNIFLHKSLIKKAKKKLHAHKNLIVIGITGSYGKTTTKEYLAHVLEQKFSVIKTPDHINVDTGVAKIILSQLKPEHQVFIVEMGAYKKGEIKSICNLVNPNYAIITGLSDQHLELFGSQKAIADAKFELVNAVKAGDVIANADSPLLVQEFEQRKINPVWYGTSSKAKLQSNDLKLSENGASFSINQFKFQTRILGAANGNNLLGVITMAATLNLSLDEISSYIADLPIVEQTMQPKKGIKNSLIIDDTYNANTQGVLSALDDLKYYNRKQKIFVFDEIIELGSQSEQDHVEIAEKIFITADKVILLPSSHYDLMAPILKDKIIDQKQLTSIINHDTVVLIEGRGGETILSKLI